MGNYVIKTLERLKGDVMESSLLDNEKEALVKLIGILDAYYIKKSEEIYQSNQDRNYDMRLARLTSVMTDYIVSINDTIKGKNDAYSIVNIIYKEVNYDNTKGQFKRKRLI